MGRQNWIKKNERSGCVRFVPLSGEQHESILGPTQAGDRRDFVLGLEAGRDSASCRVWQYYLSFWDLEQGWSGVLPALCSALYPYRLSSVAVKLQVSERPENSVVYSQGIRLLSDLHPPGSPFQRWVPSRPELLHICSDLILAMTYSADMHSKVCLSSLFPY